MIIPVAATNVINNGIYFLLIMLNLSLSLSFHVHANLKSQEKRRIDM